jgi:hypothetical protein
MNDSQLYCGAVLSGGIWQPLAQLIPDLTISLCAEAREGEEVTTAGVYGGHKFATRRFDRWPCRVYGNWPSQHTSTPQSLYHG